MRGRNFRVRREFGEKEEEMSEWMLVFQGLLAFVLVGLVLLQRSEGGALGIGGSAMNNFMTPGGTVGFLTKLTAVVGCIFMVAGLLFSYIAKESATERGLFDGVEVPQEDSRVIEVLPEEGGGVPLAE
jgi:preprotein translocase subunit SecG